MDLCLLRHATLVLDYFSHRILVDPMLSEAGAMEPVQNAANPKRIPLVNLPLDARQLAGLLEQIDAVLVTHLHRDHWDAPARELLRKAVPIICQAGDETAIREAGFTSVEPVMTELEWGGIHFSRTGGRHGTGEIGQKMGRVSGFVLRAAGEPVVYIAGDTIWCPEVADALHAFRPDTVVVNAGAAQFLTGGPITMTAEDVTRVSRALPRANVVAVHMEAVNHCGLTRKMLRQSLRAEGIADGRVLIPDDGERIYL